jgi:WD40 repeat protein
MADEQIAMDALAPAQLGPNQHLQSTISESTSNLTGQPSLSQAALKPLWVFSQNVAEPSPIYRLPQPGARLVTPQLVYCNHLLRTCQSPSSTSSIISTLNSAQQASVNAILQDKEERTRIRWLTTRVVEEFMASSVKSPSQIAEVIRLGPFLDQEYHRQLLNCLVLQLETPTLFNTDILQGLVELVECAQTDYLLPGAFVRILALLLNRLQNSHSPSQSTNHPYNLICALSRLLDVAVEGKIKGLQRIMNPGPLLAFLGHLTKNSDPFLRYQAAYALQAIMHLSLPKSDCGTAASVRDGVQSGEMRLWYSGLREAQEYVRSGRLADFNRLVFDPLYCRDVEFQWGVCPLLGEIAVDSKWEITNRRHAVDLLAYLYRNETGVESYEEIHKWILQILRQVAFESRLPLSSYLQSTLRRLRIESVAAKQALYSTVMDSSPIRLYPLKARLYVPIRTSLLAQVQAVSDIEYSIFKLKRQRMKCYSKSLYIPPQAKPTLKSSDDTLFPLMEKTLKFLAGSGQVFLILGDSGGGKSTFNLQLEHTLWQDYKRGKPIPLHINLPTIDNPQQSMIPKHLQQLDFSDAQILELKQKRQFIVICDGYDESQLKKNLYTTNQWNQPGQWNVKAVISCRTQYLGSNYRSQFQPTVDRYAQSNINHFQEAVLAPFSRSQIEQYVNQYVEQFVEQYVQQVRPRTATSDQPTWNVKEYMDKLVNIPNLIDLVSNPFLLTLALRALPRVVRPEHNLSVIQLTRVGLYDNFMEEWLENNKRRLEDSALSSEAQSTFDILRDEGFVQLGIKYQKDLAAAIFQHQDGSPVVEYSHIREQHTWKANFFSPDAQATILREASPLARSGNQFRFLHRSILEYLYSRVMSDPVDPESAADESFIEHPLNRRSIVGEPSVMQFLSERVDLDSSFKHRLLVAVVDSKLDAKVCQAAANAMSILTRAGVRFNGADLRGIKIPGADLHGGQFDSADLEGADLSNVNLSKTWLRQANLSKSQMAGVEFGELPYLKIDLMVWMCVFSADGDFLVVSAGDCLIVVYDTASWSRITDYIGGRAIASSPTNRELAKFGDGNTVELGDILTGEARLILVGHSDEVTSIAYSPDGLQLATASKDTAVRIWSTLSGETLYILSDHSKSVTGVAFSPKGTQIASCSEDRTVRTWDTRTRKPQRVLESGNSTFLSVAYSLDGSRIISGVADGRIGQWDPYTGNRCNNMLGHSGPVLSVAYSPNGYQISSCGEDGTVLLWDSRNGELFSTLSGHLLSVTDVAYSPTGDCIASGGWDMTVRLWKVNGTFSDVYPNGNKGWLRLDFSSDGEHIVTRNDDMTVQYWETFTGEPVTTSTGHTDGVSGITFSPCGNLTATFNSDRTVRLWRNQAQTPAHILSGHTGAIYGIAFSPNGLQVASASADKTIRTWDVHTGESRLLLEGHSDEVNDVVYSPSGAQIASCSDDGAVRLWCTEKGDQLFVLSHQAAVQQLMYSPDGQELISVSSGDGSLRRWDPEYGEQIFQQDAISQHIVSCCFSPNGKLVATGTGDGLLHLWDRTLGDWQEVLRSSIGLTFRIRWMQSFDCMYLACLSYSGVLRVLRLVELRHEYSLRMMWSIGKAELSLSDTSLAGAVGLSPFNVGLAAQRGAYNADS